MHRLTLAAVACTTLALALAPSAMAHGKPDVSRYRTLSPDLRVKLPEDDLFDVDARSLRFTADGWAPLIEPLKPGHHVITVRSAGTFPGNPGFDDTGTMQLDVLRH
jgi:hypothetical protein